MSSKSHIVFPGSFVRTTLASRKFANNLQDSRCWLCGYATFGPFYLLLQRQEEGSISQHGAIVCARCMGDPWEHGELIRQRVCQQAPWWEGSASV